MTINLDLEYYDGTYCRVHACEGVLNELKELFEYYVNGYRFMPDYQNNIWDGKIQLFEPETCLLQLGHVYHVKKYCDDEGINLRLDKRVKDQILNPDYDEKEVDDYLDSFNIVIGGNKIELYAEQRFAVHVAIKLNRVLLMSPTSSGKSLILFLLLEWHLRKGIKGKLLVTVPKVSLVNQLLTKNFKEYISDTDVMTMDMIYGIAGKNQDKEAPQKIIVATWQSIYKMPWNWFKRFEFSILDEAHNARGTSLQGIHKKLVNAKIKIGMTGTLDDTKVSQLVVEGVTGKQVVIAKTKDMIEQGKMAKLKIKGVMLDYTHEESFSIKQFKYPQESKYIQTHQIRTDTICKICSKVEGNMLVIFNNVEHGKDLSEWMEKYYPGKQIFNLSGKDSIKRRAEVIDITEKCDDVVIFATYGIFQEGISINNLMHGLIASPAKSKTRTLQFIGRLLRLHPNKEYATLWDIIDDFRYLKRGGKNTHENYAYLHGVDRLNMYVKEGHEYKIIRFEMPERKKAKKSKK